MAAGAALHVRTGTSGYSYKEWRGIFYPPDAKPEQMLGYYATRLATVEINNTFYRMPTDKALAGWRDQVAGDFSFVLKAPRQITHVRRLAGAGETVEHLLRASDVLGDRRGPFLFQLPPHFRKDAARLGVFVAGLPQGLAAAFEFRHDSWFDDEVYEILRARDLALVVADVAAAPEPPIRPTASFGYLRLRRDDYDEAALVRWAARVRDQPWKAAWVFFKHEGEAVATQYAERFAALCGAVARVVP